MDVDETWESFYLMSDPIGSVSAPTSLPQTPSGGALPSLYSRPHGEYHAPLLTGAQMGVPEPSNDQRPQPICKQLVKAVQSKNSTFDA